MRARGLYPIVDTLALRARGIAIVDFAREVVAARPPLLQLRAKELGARETLDLLRALLPLCRAAGTLLFANDRPDLAVLAQRLGAPPITRYAPSPTGYLHLGHVVNAIYVWGIARALKEFNGEHEAVLRQQSLLTRDSREVERKKYGRAGARKSFQFSKR